MAECILKNNDVTKFDIIPVGGAIFPTMSFFNHSCYPNAQRLGYQVGQTESESDTGLPAVKPYMSRRDTFSGPLIELKKTNPRFKLNLNQFVGHNGQGGHQLRHILKGFQT